MMSDVRLLHALDRIWNDLPTLCGEHWPRVQQRLSDLLYAYEQASDEDERARVALDIQDVIEACSQEAARRLYEEMTHPARKAEVSPEVLLGRLRAYLPPPGPPVVPPVLYVCPVPGCPYERQVADPAAAGECPTHHVPLVRAGEAGAGETGKEG